MLVIQEAFYIPPDIATGIATGLYRRHGGVIRYAAGPHKGQIVKHLMSMDIPVAEEATGLAAKVIKFAKNNKKALIIVVTAAAVIGGGTAIYYGIRNHESAVVTDFKKALFHYIEAIRNGTMDIEKIKCLMEAIKKTEQHKDFDKFIIKLSAEDFDILVKRIHDYTMKLAQDNNLDFMDENENDGDNTIISLQKYLKIQKSLFEVARSAPVS